MPATMTSRPMTCSPLIPLLIARATPKPNPTVPLPSQSVTTIPRTSVLRSGDSEISEQPRNGAPVKTPQPCRCPTLAMLILQPGHGAPLPRLHVAWRAPNGNWTVYDRASGEQFVAYSPRFNHQFHAGHRAGLWYLRSATIVESGPQSQGYATARASLDALRAGHWDLSTAIRDQPRKLARVIWSTRASERSSPA
jgi:hypothetical protein